MKLSFDLIDTRNEIIKTFVKLEYVLDNGRKIIKNIKELELNQQEMII